MKHTLLPLPERNILRREYRIRAGIVLCFMISIAGLIGIGALFPAFFRANMEEQSGISLVSSLKKGKDQSGITKIEKDLAVANVILKNIAESEDAVRLSTVIDSVLSTRGNIKLTSLSLTRIASSSVAVAIQGLAPSRDALLSFKTRLEQLSQGNAVNLPISELAKSVNLRFSLELAHLIP